MFPLAAVLEIARVTLRQLMGRRRTLLILLLSGLPILLAFAFRATDTISIKDFSDSSFDGITVTILMPLVAILFGAGAFGAEVDEGTIVYLLAKPLGRIWIGLAKGLTAAIIASLLTGLSTAIAGVIVLGGVDNGISAVEAQVFGVVVGSICYAALFMAVSLFTRRALVIGIGYMLIWEGALSSLLSGIANFSVRQYALGAAGAVYKLPIEAARLAPQTALVLAAVLIVGSFAIATWRLMRFELPGGD